MSDGNSVAHMQYGGDRPPPGSARASVDGGGSVGEMSERSRSSSQGPPGRVTISRRAYHGAGGAPHHQPPPRIVGPGAFTSLQSIATYHGRVEEAAGFLPRGPPLRVGPVRQCHRQLGQYDRGY